MKLGWNRPSICEFHSAVTREAGVTETLRSRDREGADFCSAPFWFGFAGPAYALNLSAPSVGRRRSVDRQQKSDQLATILGIGQQVDSSAGAAMRNIGH